MKAKPRHLELVNRPSAGSGGYATAFTEAGMPEELQTRMDRHFAGIRGNFHPLLPDRLLSGGEAIPTAIGRLQVLWTPGHSPGHICLYCPEQSCCSPAIYILRKDHTEHRLDSRREDALAEFLAVARRLEEVEIDLILPSHGLPFRGHRAVDRTNRSSITASAAMKLRMLNTGPPTRPTP